MSENFKPNVCGKYALQGSSRALYTPLDPTHNECTWPVPFHEAGCTVLIRSGAVKDGILLGWSDLPVWCDGGGLIWWADFGGLVWRWSGVVVGAWSDLWSDLRVVWLSDVTVWRGADLMGCWCGLVPWPNLKVWLRRIVWRLKIKKMRNWGNSSDKALNPSESYVQRNEEKIRKYFIFLIQ